VQVVTWNDYGEGTIVEPTLDYGVRDLGILQDFRRQYLDAGFAYHTNELGLALRLYNLRRQAATNAIISAELDRVFTNAVSGNLALAGLQLTGLEATRPVIYSALVTGGQLSFSIGGYLSTAGLQVQTSSNLAVTSWQTVTSLPAATSQPTFSIPVATEGRSAFFRVRNAGP
jgi:hypothetical protein